MTDAMDNGDLWLPSEFLTDDDILRVHGNLSKNAINTAFTNTSAFPVEFPHEFGSYGSSALNSPVESVAGSTETECDEEDLLSCLTRQLARSSMKDNVQKISYTQKNVEKSRVMSVSPQSLLSGVGSRSGHSVLSNPSPPALPFRGIDSCDLIRAAAGQVARLKISGEYPAPGGVFLATSQILDSIQDPSSLPVRNYYHNTGFYGNRSFSQNLSQGNRFGNAKQEQSPSIWGSQIQLQQQAFDSSGRYERKLGLAKSSWLPLQVQCQTPQNHPPQHCAPGMRADFLGGSVAKRECAGTGVFLPRRYGSNNLSECRKKPDKLMSRRNATSNHQQGWNRPEGRMNHDLCLPQEWTY